MAGFQCSTSVWKDGQRKDYVAVTHHDCPLEVGYSAAIKLGIGTVREAIRWLHVYLDEGRYDWSSVCEPPLGDGMGRRGP